LRGALVSVGQSVHVASPVRQSRETVQQAKELSARYATLFECVQASKLAGQKNVLAACALQEHISGRPPARYFWLNASVDGHCRFAVWSDNRLIVHPELAARADLVTQLGETFQEPDSGCSVPAGLDEPIQAALTLIRAADRILNFNLRVDGLAVVYPADRGAA
jgi:hypothetical protein